MLVGFDAAKREETLRERGLDFADAFKVFDGRAKTIIDDRFDYAETRQITYGWLDDVAVAVVWTDRQGTCRVISMRRMHNGRSDMSAWTDPDDAPELTEEMAAVAEIAIGGKVIRPATGYLGPNGVVRGRPPLRERSKRQLTLRLDPDVIDKFREGGPGWQGRINEALRKAVGLK